jgi:hypothetical protein
MYQEEFNERTRADAVDRVNSDARPGGRGPTDKQRAFIVDDIVLVLALFVGMTGHIIHFGSGDADRERRAHPESR